MVPNALILPGDLAFFTRPGDASIDPCTGPDRTPQEWHTMIVSSPTTSVIGVCSTLGYVRELPVAEYTCLKDDRGRRWSLEGYVRPPGV
jgi:hypothetical protein